MTIAGIDIKQLITMFEFKNNTLNYQILLDLNNGNKISVGEFVNYQAYKTAYEEIQNSRKKNITLQIAENQELKIEKH